MEMKNSEPHHGNINKEKISKAEMKKIVDSLKKWLEESPDRDTKVILSGDKEFSVNDTIKEIEEGSERGKRLIRSWINLRTKI